MSDYRILEYYDYFVIQKKIEEVYYRHILFKIFGIFPKKDFKWISLCVYYNEVGIIKKYKTKEEAEKEIRKITFKPIIHEV